MPDIREVKVKMSDSEAIKVINRIRGCRYDERCKMECEKCPCNYTDEELHEALGRATKSLNDTNYSVVVELEQLKADIIRLEHEYGTGIYTLELASEIVNKRLEELRKI